MHLLSTTLSMYGLTDEEALQGAILTLVQGAVIQNEIAQVAEEKLALRFDPEHPSLFMQEEAYKSGQIAALKYRLECSLVAREELSQRGNEG